MPLSIRLREPKDDEAIAAVVAAAFGGRNEVTLIAALRREGDMVSECVALTDDAALAGYIAFSRLDVVNASGMLRATALAPLAVAPDRQNQGIGQALTRHAIGRLRDRGHDLIVVLGHPAYYARFGFSSVVAKLLDAPYSGDSFMALELAPGMLGNTRWRVDYPRAFSDL